MVTEKDAWLYVIQAEHYFYFASTAQICDHKDCFVLFELAHIQGVDNEVEFSLIWFLEFSFNLFKLLAEWYGLLQTRVRHIEKLEAAGKNVLHSSATMEAIHNCHIVAIQDEFLIEIGIQDVTLAANAMHHYVEPTVLVEL